MPNVQTISLMIKLSNVHFKNVVKSKKTLAAMLISFVSRTYGHHFNCDPTKYNRLCRVRQVIINADTEILRTFYKGKLPISLDKAGKLWHQ